MDLRAGRRAVLAGLAASLVAPGAFALDAPLPRPRPFAGGAKRVAAPGQSPERLAGASGSSGWLAVDLDTGAVLDSENAIAAFAPASVAKLPTAVYALDRLGPAHRFETRLALRGRLEGGRIVGDLILAGGGDPELDSDALLPFVMALKEAGVTRVEGRFLVDCGGVVEQAAIDPTQPEDASYNPAISGLNLNFNRVRVEWPARAASSDIKVTARSARLNPYVRHVRVVASTGRAGPILSHAMEGRGEIWSVADRVLSKKGGRWLPVRRPALYAGDVFGVLAATHGITLPPAEEGKAAPGDRVLMVHRSQPLVPILDSMLHHSTNLTAEVVGQAASGHGSDLGRSAAAMNIWAAGRAGFPSGDAGFAFTNHSGLSTVSRVSPERMVAFLRAVAGAPLPLGSEPGDPRLPTGVARILRPYNVAAKSVKLDYDRLTVAAKTGTMDYVRGLAGYIVTPRDRRIAFAVFSNHLGRRDGDGRGIDRGWMARARGFERALIRNWVLKADA